MGSLCSFVLGGASVTYSTPELRIGQYGPLMGSTQKSKPTYYTMGWAFLFRFLSVHLSTVSFLVLIALFSFMIAYVFIFFLSIKF